MRYRVTIPREKIEEMARSEREEVEATLAGLADTPILTRQDRIDDTDESREGAIYHTDDATMSNILTAIATMGYSGLVANREKINQIAAEQGENQ